MKAKSTSKLSISKQMKKRVKSVKKSVSAQANNTDKTKISVKKTPLQAPSNQAKKNMAVKTKLRRPDKFHKKTQKSKVKNLAKTKTVQSVGIYHVLKARIKAFMIKNSNPAKKTNPALSLKKPTLPGKKKPPVKKVSLKKSTKAIKKSLKLKINSRKKGVKAMLKKARSNKNKAARLYLKKVRLIKRKAIKLHRKTNEKIRDLKWRAKNKTAESFNFIFIRHKRITVTLASFSLLSVSLFYVFFLKDLPSPRQLSSAPVPQTTIIRDRNGRVLYRIYNRANRVNLSWDEIPQNVKQSTLAIEDATFYKHFGVSLKAITRAFLHNLGESESRLYHGGSTITQQLVKNRLLSPEKTYTRKIKEIILSLETDFMYEKEEILNMYLNEVGYGGPAYGIEAASQMYFAKPAKNLTLAEAAFLAGLPAAPTTFSPFGANPELSFTRQKQVLTRMFELGMLNEETYKNTLEEKLVFAPQIIDIKAPHFVMYIKSLLVDRLGEERVEEGGLDVTTTLDLDIQEKAQIIVAENIQKLGPKYRIGNAGTVITDPKNGELLAMIGSANFFDIENKGYVNVTTSLRQPGSSIKPVNYAYAFDHGYTPNSTIHDAPVVYTAPGSKEKYAPVNYDGKFHGTVTLRSALANSYNIPAVRLLNNYGVDKMLELGMKMGIKSWRPDMPSGLSLTLGGSEVTMLDMARVYGTIATMGKKSDLAFIKEIRDSKGDDLLSLVTGQTTENGKVIREVRASNEDSVITPLSAWWLIDILADNAARRPAFGNYSKLSIPDHKVAVKTGTSNNFRDNWTIGFSPDYLVAVWVGNNDGSFMNKNLVSGVTGAAPIWHETMSFLLEDKEPKDFEKPEGLVPVKVCAVNGLLTCANCPEEKIEYFTVDKVPTKKCYFKPAAECIALKAQAEAEGKSDEEKKAILSGCYFGAPKGN